MDQYEISGSFGNGLAANGEYMNATAGMDLQQILNMVGTGCLQFCPRDWTENLRMSLETFSVLLSPPWLVGW